LPVAHISEVLFWPFDVKLMNFRVKDSSYLTGGARKIDHHAAGINDIHFEAVRFKPVGEFIEISIGLGRTLSPNSCALIQRWKFRDPTLLRSLEELPERSSSPSGGPAQTGAACAPGPGCRPQRLDRSRRSLPGGYCRAALRAFLHRYSGSPEAGARLPDTACAWAELWRKQKNERTDCEKRKNLRRQGMRAPFVLGELARAGGPGTKETA